MSYPSCCRTCADYERLWTRVRVQLDDMMLTCVNVCGRAAPERGYLSYSVSAAEPSTEHSCFLYCTSSTHDHTRPCTWWRGNSGTPSPRQLVDASAGRRSTPIRNKLGSSYSHQQETSAGRKPGFPICRIPLSGAISTSMASLPGSLTNREQVQTPHFSLAWVLASAISSGPHPQRTGLCATRTDSVAATS